MGDFERRAVAPVIVRGVSLCREMGERSTMVPAHRSLRRPVELEFVFPMAWAKNGKRAGEKAGSLGYHLVPLKVMAADQTKATWRVVRIRSPNPRQEVLR